MIAVFHFLFWTMKQVLKLYHDNFTLETEREIDGNYFEENKVKYNNAYEDAETGLKFDPPVYLQRYFAVQDILLNKKWRDKIVKVVDFGCAELKLFKFLKCLINIQEVLLVDVDEDILQNNAFRIQPFNADYLERRRKPLHAEVIQGSIDYPDPKLISVDAVICIEIIEHLYPDTLDALPHNIFHFIQPRIALFTTPNADFNELFPNFSGTRHYDHKFEWTRQQFQDWAQNIVVRYPIYSVYFVGIGPGPVGKKHLGDCSQMAVFVKKDMNLVETLSQISSKDYCLEEFESFGICKYQSYVSNSIPNKYQIISDVDFPYEVDDRTEEEIILHETEYRLHRLACYKKDFKYDLSDLQIPLFEVTSNRGGKFISASEIRAILQKAGWKIEDIDIDGTPTPCVIYEISASSVSSLPSPSPNLNFSTEANWDSGSQWDLESTENWDENISIMDKEINESTGEVWEDASSHEHSNTRISDTVEEDSPISDPCISGEPAGATDERIELLFDSGYQVSTSSIELSPELSKDWLSDEAAKAKPELENVRSIKSEKEYKQNDDNNTTTKISESYLFKQRKKNKVKLEDALPVPVPVYPNRPPVVVAPPVAAAEIENPVVVENGDLANNNRDLEGNNYQAAENREVQIDDNAVPRPENLDEHNENHIVIEREVFDPIHQEYHEEEDAADVLEDASREVLFDPNSESNLSDDSFLLQGHGLAVSFDDYAIPLLQRIPSQPRASSEEHFRTTMGFPSWLLQMLNINREEIEADDEENAHFYSQGDGVGVHPSTTEVSEDSSSSSSHTTAERENTLFNVAAEDASTTESNYEDALENVHASGSQEPVVNVQRDNNTDGNQSSSRNTGQ